MLTRTNKEALQVTGLLQHHGLPARLVQSNDGYTLTFVTVNDVVFWRKEGDEQDFRVVLPACGFERNH
jgi:hypothetical protein